MRLSKFLSLSVAMSRNQAKFFIRKGRLSVDDTVITDPEFELDDASRVVFDGKPISIAGYRYIVLHKPPSYACTTKDTEHDSVLSLLKDRTEDHYFYYANVLAPEVSGLVLVSDDARWANRIKRRVITKPRVYEVNCKKPIDEDQLRQIQEASRSSTARSASLVDDLQRQDARTLLLKTGNVGIQRITEALVSMDLDVESLHLIQIGRLSLGDLPEGDCLELGESDIKI